MTFHRLVTRADLFDGYKQAFIVNGTAVLLVQTEGKIYAVENKCGHFGIALDTGRVIGARIQCSQHGASLTFVRVKSLITWSRNATHCPGSSW